MNKARFLTFALASALALGGCAGYKVHPGAINQMDSAAYDTLLMAEGVIDASRIQLTAGTLPASAKPLLSTVISAYNVAETAWQVYHSTGDANMGVTLQTNLNALAQAIVALKGAE